jgi:hypothetical protein
MQVTCSLTPDPLEAGATNYIGLEIKNLMFMTLIAANRLIVAIDTHRI